jgi:hypothetical protein
MSSRSFDCPKALVKRDAPSIKGGSSHSSAAAGTAPLHSTELLINEGKSSSKVSAGGWLLAAECFEHCSDPASADIDLIFCSNLCFIEIISEDSQTKRRIANEEGHILENQIEFT